METLQNVLARWAYSEIGDANRSSNYDGLRGIEVLRAKRANKVSFPDLLSEDHDALGAMWTFVRGTLFKYVYTVASFKQIKLTREQLANILVFPEASHDLKGEFATFQIFMNLPRTDMGDCRGESLPYDNQAEALTFGHHDGQQVLIDGYHRAVSFWKFAPEGAVIAAYDPVF